MPKKFAVITVCLNTEEKIAQTLASVLEQSCVDFEYLIKDGGSKDCTLKIAESFAAAFSQKGIVYRVISCADQGIYDAMNQAAKEVQGKWVLYLNAGDQLADENVLARVSRSGLLETADIVYGDMVEKKGDMYRYKKAYPLEKIRETLPFCHQSVFARNELYKEEPYSLKYRLCSDYLFFFHKYREGKHFAYIPCAISVFDRGGATSNRMATMKDMLRIHEDMPTRDEEVILRRKKLVWDQAFRDFIHRYVACFVPQRIRIERRKKGWKRNGWITQEEYLERKGRSEIGRDESTT